MEQLRFRERGAVAWLGTPPTIKSPTHAQSRMCKLAAGRPVWQQPNIELC